jgi:hypothetical protein
VRKDLSPSESAAFFLNELTGCEGLEFVTFSNARLTRPVTLVNDVVLVPCFLSEIEEQNVQEPLVQLTMKMARECRFIYDGWIPIKVWDVPHVRKAVRGIDEALAMFCLRGRTFFEWEPKYPSAREAPLPHSYYIFEDRHLRDLQTIAGLLGVLPEVDRVAVYRSIGWLSQASRLDQPAARFLFCILAIEALATYIEEEAPDESPLARLRTERLTKAEKRARRERCIAETLGEWLPRDKTGAIRESYFNCVVGIRERLKTHLERLFTSEAEPVALLFEQHVEGKPLYELRHTIAHGTADALSAGEMEGIRQRIWDVERIAGQYILSVFKKALAMQPLSEGISVCVPGLPQSGIVSSELMYQGPTHMAFLYF